jgi:hypothetical protein
MMTMIEAAATAINGITMLRYCNDLVYGMLQRIEMLQRQVRYATF